MKGKITGVFLAIVLIFIVSGIVFADAAGKRDADAAYNEQEPKGVNFSAALLFASEESQQVKIKLSNDGDSDLVVANQAYYIDDAGSAGSWDCEIYRNASSLGGVTIAQGETKTITFQIEQSVTHGDNSILSFYFEQDGVWYLGKTGIKNGTEYFIKHN